MPPWFSIPSDSFLELISGATIQLILNNLIQQTANLNSIVQTTIQITVDSHNSDELDHTCVITSKLVIDC